MIKKKNLYKIFGLLIFAGSIASSCDLLPMPEQTFFEEVHDLTVGEVIPGEKLQLSTDLPLFSWNVSDNVQSCGIQVSQNESFSGNLLIDEKGIFGTTYQSKSPLPAYGLYYWRIRYTVDTGEVSSWYVYNFYYLPENSVDSFEVNDGSFSALNKWSLSSENKPFIQSEEIYDGSFAVEFQSPDYQDNSYMETTIVVEDPSILSFFYKIHRDASSSSTLSCNINRSNNSHSLVKSDTEEWIHYQLYLYQGTNVVKWQFYSNSYNVENRAWIDAISLNLIPDFSEVLSPLSSTDFTINNFTLAGDVNPYIVPNETHDNYKIIKMGDYGITGENSFEMNVTVVSDCLISFDMKKTGRGNFTFYIDDIQKKASSGTLSDWTDYKFYLAPGNHTLKWVDKKDYGDINDFVYLSSLLAIPVPNITEALSQVISADFTINSYTLDGDTAPYIMPDETYSGNEIIKLGVLESSGENSVEFNITAATDCLFSYVIQKNDSGGTFYTYLDGTSQYQTSSSFTDWTIFNIYIPAGNHTLKWRHDKYYDNADEIVKLTFLSAKPIPSISNAFTLLTDSEVRVDSYLLSGDLDPYILPDETYSGNSIIQFGPGTSSNESILELNVTLSTAKTVSFNIQKNTYFYFYIDGTPVWYDSSEIDSWTEKSYTLNAGSHTLKWKLYYYYRAWAQINSINIY